MKYITYNRFKGKSICGNINLPYGTELESVGDFLVYNNKIICAIDSENGRRHFCRNDDKNGLIRGKLIYIIAYKAEKPGFRFSKSQINTLEQKYERFLEPEQEFIIFNKNLFTATIEELESIIKDLGW